MPNRKSLLSLNKLKLLRTVSRAALPYALMQGIFKVKIRNFKSESGMNLLNLAHFIEAFIDYVLLETQMERILITPAIRAFFFAEL